MTFKRSGHRMALILAITALGYGSTVPSANAALTGYDDSHSYNGGTDTLEAVLGFDMIGVTDAPVEDGVFVSSLSSPFGDVEFGPSLQKLTVPSVGWATWSHGYTGTVYFRNGEDFVITLPDLIPAFDLYLEPNVFGIFEITATAEDGSSVMVSQDVEGMAGAKYFGFTSDDGIMTITISAPAGADGFAVAEFRMPEPIPAPGAVTLGLLGLGAVAFKRRRG